MASQSSFVYPGASSSSNQLVPHQGSGFSYPGANNGQIVLQGGGKRDVVLSGVVGNSSGAMVGKSLGGGVLSTKQEDQEFKQTAVVIQAMSGELMTMMSDGSKAMKRFVVVLQKADDRFSTFMFELLDQVHSAGDVSQADMNRSAFYRDTVVSIKNQFEHSMELQLTLSSKAMKSYGENCRVVIDTIAHAQTKRLEIFSAKLDVLHKHEKHEIEMAKEEQEMIIARENAILENLIKNGQHQAEMRKADSELVMAKESHDQQLELNVRASDREDRIARDRHEEKVQELDQNHELGRIQAKNQRAIEESRIEADKQARLGEAAASASKCSVM